LGNLSPAEQRLDDELLALARTLDKRGVPGVYGQVAVIVDEVTALKNGGHNAIAALARGLDSLKKIDANYTGQRLATIRGVMSHHELWILGGFLSLRFGLCFLATDPGIFYTASLLLLPSC
jgi:hypothetical protein